MCSTLITIFSGYRIFNFAVTLGIRYLDKFERVIDYHVTYHILELICITVRIALYQYVKNKEETMNDILKGNNQFIKMWYLFFCWTGYFIGHKIGIKRGNYKMQMSNLAAFTPLFLAAGKFKYVSFVTYFLA